MNVYARSIALACSASCLFANSAQAGNVGFALSINAPPVQAVVVSNNGWNRVEPIPQYHQHRHHGYGRQYPVPVRYPVPIPVYTVPTYVSVESQTTVSPSNSQYGSTTVSYGGMTCIVPWNSIITYSRNRPPHISIPGGPSYYCGG